MDALPLGSGDHVLEVGCGKGELLVRPAPALAGRDGRGLRPQSVVPGRRPRGGRGGRRRVVRRVSFVETDCAGALIADRAVGADHRDRARRASSATRPRPWPALAAATRPGGTVAVRRRALDPRAAGRAAWRRSGWRATSCPTGIDGFAALGVEAGLEPSTRSRSSSDAEWDAYEAAYAARRSRPGPRRTPTIRSAAAFLARAQVMRDSYASLAARRVRLRDRAVPRPGLRSAPAQAEMTPTMISSSRRRAAASTRRRRRRARRAPRRGSGAPGRGCTRGRRPARGWPRSRRPPRPSAGGGRTARGVARDPPDRRARRRR